MEFLISIDEVQAVFPDAFSEVERGAVERFIEQASDLIYITFRNNHRTLDDSDELLYDNACHVCLDMVRRAIEPSVVTDTYQYGTTFDSPMARESNYRFTGRIYWEKKELDLLGLSRRGGGVHFAFA